MRAAGGMETFHAINHAMSTVATGGFSTHDTPRPAICRTCRSSCGPVASSCSSAPAVLDHDAVCGARRPSLDAPATPRIRVFAGYGIVLFMAVAIYLRVRLDMPFFDAVTHSTFNLLSMVTTAGFASDDYTLWGPFAHACIFVATFLGGCSGSTTGGVRKPIVS